MQNLSCKSKITFLLFILTLFVLGNIQSSYAQNIHRIGNNSNFKTCRICGKITITKDVCDRCQALEKSHKPKDKINLGVKMVKNGDSNGWIYIIGSLGIIGFFIYYTYNDMNKKKK